MSDIRILSETLSNKIAAGEVVARPASVVKELIENSLDAHASLITLEIENGGRTLIRVSDSGTGMAKDNALLSIERFATSKILNDKDLFSISTMGFRGEALPSIASVSKFTLVTRAKGEDSGTNIIISGGKLLNVTEIGAPIGTMVEVKNLFFNTPARKKFLKSTNTEMSHIADIFSSIALGNKYIGFRFISNGKLIKNFTSSDSLNERAIKVLGKDLSANLLKVDCKESNISISGFISSPEITRSSTRMIRLFVNNRLVNDRGIVSAMLNGYKGHLMKSRFPLAVIYVSLPFDKVDINVHPAKNEVRFLDAKTVYNIVVKAVKKSLDQVKEEFYKDVIAPEAIEAQETSKIPKPQPKQAKSAQAVEESLFEYTGPVHTEPPPPAYAKAKSEKPPQPVEPKSPKVKPVEKIKTKPAKKSEPPPPISKAPPAPASKAIAPPAKAKINEKGKFLIKGQVMSTYIVAETDDGLILVDQHAAHERIVFEKLKAANKNSAVQSQTLLMPETLELGFFEANILTEMIEELKDYGFEIEPFGGTTFVVKSIPAIIDKKETAPLIIEMIDNIVDKKTSSLKNQWLDDVLILMACHSAIRANHKLSTYQMEQLLSDLGKCANPLHCPHGRPIMIKWTKKDVEKMFKRIV
jgi:DNA mismatch repair protein MutL